MTLQEHYSAIKSGKGNKDQFLKQARNLFPEYFNQYTDFDTATNVLKSKQIISEAAGGVVAKGFDIYDWKKILAEETKATEKETSKEVLDDQNNAYNNSDMKNADNVNFNEIMKGFYAEMRDEKNAGKTGDEIKAMVVKNLAKDPLFYTKDGMFGVKGLGYTTEAPGLGEPKEPKGKFKSSGYGDIEKEVKVKSNVKDSLGDSEAKTSMPKKVKEMPDKGVSGVEKKVRLQEYSVYQGDVSKMKPESTPKDGEVYLKDLKAGDKFSIDKLEYIIVKPETNNSGVEVTYADGTGNMKLKGSAVVKLKENIQDRADAINIFARIVKRGDNNEIANSFEANRDYGMPKVSDMVTILKKYGKYDEIMSMVDDDFTDPAGGSGLSSHLEEQKLRSLIRNIIKEELEEANLGHNETWSLEPEGRFWILTYSTMNGKKEKIFNSEDEAKNWIKQNLDEAMDQGPVSIKGKTGPTGGAQKIPRALFLDKEVISSINNAQPGSIKLISKPGDKRVYMYVSPFVKNALDELERGRSSREKLKKQSKLADILSDKLPSAIRGKIKKEINPKMDSGLKMHYVDLNISPKKDKTGYWVLAKGENEPLVTEEQKLRSLIRNLIKEELVNEISPELFKRATDMSRGRGQDQRTSSMGEAFFSKFKGKPLMGGTIANIRYVKPQQGNYEDIIVKMEFPSSVVPGETKFRYATYDVKTDQWDVDKEITRADARVLSLIAQHINPDTRYRSGGEGFQIKGY